VDIARALGASARWKALKKPDDVTMKLMKSMKKINFMIFMSFMVGLPPRE
jgi:hypothetical protein